LCSQHLDVDSVRIVGEERASTICDAVDASTHPLNRPRVLEVNVSRSDAVVVKAAFPARKELGAFCCGNVKSVGELVPQPNGVALCTISQSLEHEAHD